MNEVKRVTKREAVKTNRWFVENFLNLSRAGINEIYSLIEKNKGEILLVMHPNSLKTRDQGDDGNRKINEKITDEFTPWIVGELKKRKESLDIGNETLPPIFIFVEEHTIDEFRANLEKNFGNHLTKFGVVFLPTERNMGRVNSDLEDVVLEAYSRFGIKIASNQMSQVAYSGIKYLFDLLAVKKIKLAGGFIGEKDPGFLGVYGRCLGKLLSYILLSSKQTRKIEIVATQNVFYKDGTLPRDLETAGVTVEK